MPPSPCTIRPALASDLATVLQVETLAFGQEIEANLVKDLLSDPTAQPSVSLLAWQNNQAVGHILFTAAHLSHTAAAILAPLAVIPTAQRQGIGTQLVQAGCSHLAQAGVDLVFVLGDPNYYGRFGFTPALPLGLDAPYELPAAYVNAWMVHDLSDDKTPVIQGKVTCADSLSKPDYWQE
ncbi:N-acetyltransferase [Leptothoe kymatousa TAU-MAC 1615]|uniref:N-acetyltransferase n=2 Tax=Leptothoe TaxID=2651725 RepID=A0ABS5Y4J6_9CYAN|nr:N-acetyltransferase [Leptothoe kymatousa TAU-MAC 1615]